MFCRLTHFFLNFFFNYLQLYSSFISLLYTYNTTDARVYFDKKKQNEITIQNATNKLFTYLSVKSTAKGGVSTSIGSVITL